MPGRALASAWSEWRAAIRSHQKGASIVGTAPHPVFISYSRRDMADVAGALHAALPPQVSFLDSDAIELEDMFPRRLAAALEAAQVVVVLATPGYFERWYCLREWMAALLPWTSADRSVPGYDDLLQHVLVAWDGRMGTADLQRLPPPIQQLNLPSTSDIRALAGLVLERLGAGLPSLGDRMTAAGSGRASMDLFTADSALPLVAHTTAGLKTWPLTLPQSLGERFLGRADEFWRVHEALWTRRMGGATAAPKTAGLHAGGGFGKSQLALEYMHRMGPLLYPDGLLWIDATQPLEDQHRGILTLLGEPSSQVQLLSGQPLRDVLVQKLSMRREASILFVVDDLPEPSAGQPARPLRDYCPPLGHVTCLVTSRTLRWDVDVTIDLDVMNPSAAVLMLQRGLPVTSILNRSEWTAIAEWVGRLPLALDLLNASIQLNALSPQSLLDALQSVDVSPRLDALAALLKDEMPPSAVRGITDAFNRSLQSLKPGARRLALRCGWLPNAPIPRELLEALADPGQGETDVQRLVYRSFLTTSPALAGQLQMHRVMSSFLRGSSDHPEQIVNEVCLAIKKVLDVIEGSGREPLLVLLAPHVAELADRLVEYSPGSPPTADVLALLKRLMSAGEQATAGAPLLFAARGARAVLARPAISADVMTRGDLNRILGRCLYTLGSRQASTHLLAEAMIANDAALESFQEDTNPVEWARVRNQMGVTLQKWGEREADGARLEAALAAFDDALRGRAREGSWVDWAGTQNNIANALMEMGQRLEDRATVARAIEAYQAALNIYVQAQDTRTASVVRSNLGPALRLLGELTNEPAHFAEAEQELLAAWELFPRDRNPGRWADVANNIGLLQTTWGARMNDVRRIRRGLEYLNTALEVRRLDDAPIDWAMTHNNIGRAYTELGRRENSVRMLWRAVMALKRALRVRVRSVVPLDWGTSMIHLARAYAALGIMKQSQDLIQLAARAYEDGMREYDKQRFAKEWIRLQAERDDVLAAGAQIASKLKQLNP
jgi:tetratricopeptide (TPR) repeat protein